ncbi:MAG: nitroreductase family deazaflavin-dependent oxidoreductase [Gammaproteobacteria bacterium]
MVTRLVKDSAAALDAGTVPDWISTHLDEYRASGGAVGHYWDSTSVGGHGVQTCLLMTTVGRRTGKAHTHPLLYAKDGDRFIIVGSKGGSDSHPAWYHNLLAHPDVELQVGPEKFSARAALATGAERARLWALITAVFPPYVDYQARTTREIPLFSLARIEA